jgi:phosphatidylglycerophosphate synthase
MESISQLRAMCQAQRRANDTWHGIHIARPLSIYITALFLRAGISANQATYIFLLSGIIGSLFLVLSSPWMFVAGMLVMQLWYILDHVDGEIARYRSQTSLTGVYLDKVSHYISHPFIFLCIGIGLYNSYGSVLLLTASFVAGYSITMINAIDDVLNSALYHAITFSRKKSAPTEAAHAANGNAAPNVFKKAFSALHSLCTFPSVMNLLLAASIIDLFMPRRAVAWLVLFYAIFATVVWMARFFVFVKGRKADKSVIDAT